MCYDLCLYIGLVLFAYETHAGPDLKLISCVDALAKH